MLDLKLTQFALKMKNLILLDLSFPRGVFPEFKKAYDPRYIALPSRDGLAVSMASGIASFGKLVLIYGAQVDGLAGLEPTLNVKILKPSPEGSWHHLEEGLKTFGPAVLLIPE